jgi:hypothetical protein
MDRVELRKAFSSRIEKFRLEECDQEVHLKKLSALDRARIVDKHAALTKASDTVNPFETITIETQCYIVSRGLVDQNGTRLYGDDDLRAIAEEIPATALDACSKRILAISGMGGEESSAPKNSNPTPNEDSKCDSPQGSDGGTLMPSSAS